MSKAILVLDEMPECCLVCPLCRCDIELGFGYCVATDDNNKIVFGENEFCPDWCPIRELPDHMADYNPEIHPANEPFDAGYTLGWNECLNQIEGDNTDEQIKRSKKIR